MGPNRSGFNSLKRVRVFKFPLQGGAALGLHSRMGDDKRLSGALPYVADRDVGWFGVLVRFPSQR